MIFLSADEIIELHKKLIVMSGGSYGLRDRGLLESAVEGVFATFGEVERYPTIEEKAARYAYALTNNHAFIDGNKRIGIFIMLLTLELNGVVISYTQTELIHLGIYIADGSTEYDAIYTWIVSHKK